MNQKWISVEGEIQIWWIEMQKKKDRRMSPPPTPRRNICTLNSQLVVMMRECETSHGKQNKNGRGLQPTRQSFSFFVLFFSTSDCGFLNSTHSSSRPRAMMIVIAQQRLHYNMLIRRIWNKRKEQRWGGERESQGGGNVITRRKRNPQRRDKNYGRCLCLALWEVEGRAQTRRIEKNRKKER